MKATAKEGRSEKGRLKSGGVLPPEYDNKTGLVHDGCGQIVPLRGQDETHIKDPKAGKAAQEAYARFLLVRHEQEAKGLAGDSMPIMEIVAKYLETVEGQTHEVRRRFLYDFCTGYPGRFLNKGKPTAVYRIHNGYGDKTVLTFIPTMSGNGSLPTAVGPCRVGAGPESRR